MTFWVYILRCTDGSYYTGHTDSLEKRLAQHQATIFSKCYTASRLPVELVYAEYFSSRNAAFEAERKIKGWNRKKKEALIKGDWAEIIRLANLKVPNPAHPEPVEG